MKVIIRIFKWVFWTTLAISLFTFAGVGIFFYELSKTLPKNLEAELHKRNEILPTVLFDREGNQIEELYIHRRTLIPFEDAPPHLIQALIASEDTRFFRHFGIDPLRMLKALLVDIQAGGFVQGASTITQQTAREFLLTKEKQLIRKLREILLAFRMELQFSKTEILELYLNRVFLGNAEGVEAASQGYFGKHAQELSLAESALLVGLLPAPSRYAPHINPDLALQQRNRVLQRMREENFITEQEYGTSSQEPIKLIRIDDFTSEDTAYYVEHVRRYLIRQFGAKTVYQGGLRVRMAMGLDYQISAHESFQKGLLDLTKRQGYRGPLETLTLDDEENLDFEEITRITKPNRLVLGANSYGVVTETSNDLAIVNLGEASGFLEWKRVRSWQNAEDNSRDQPTPYKNLEEVVSRGDVIQVKLVDYDTIREQFRLQLYQRPLVNGALIAMQPRTGQVFAMIGGYQYEESEFNRAIQAKRQPGSAFKPIVYSASLDAGFTLSSILVDSPRAFKTGTITVGDAEIWLPKNYGNKLMGNVSLRTALVKSLNLATIGLIEDQGPERIIKYSRKLGISAPMKKNLTIALGSFSVTLQEMVNAFGVFANQGKRTRPIYILEVADQNGRILIESETEETRVLSEETAFLISDVLQDVVKRGTGFRARALGRPSAGKTGTTNDNVDAWYIGFIPQLLTGVYVGFDQPRSMGLHEAGSRAAAPIWVDFMKNAVANLPTEQFPQPPGIITVKIHQSGRRSNACDPPDEILEEHYKTGTEPRSDLMSTDDCTQDQWNQSIDSQKGPEL